MKRYVEFHKQDIKTTKNYVVSLNTFVYYDKSFNVCFSDIVTWDRFNNITSNSCSTDLEQLILPTRYSQYL